MSQVKLWSKSESESKLYTGKINGGPYPVLFLCDPYPVLFLYLQNVWAVHFGGEINKLLYNEYIHTMYIVTYFLAKCLNMH